jgi:hypothetical protein
MNMQNESTQHPDLKINFSEVEFDRHVTPCPTTFGIDRKSPYWLEQNVTTGKSLMMFSLKYACDTYMPDERTLSLARHRHDLEDDKSKDVTIRNCSFYVTIGTKDSYDRSLAKSSSKSNKGSHSPKQINLKSESDPTYQDLFRDFFFKKFEGDESTYLDQCYEKNNMITIAIFARSGTKTKKKA